MFSPSLTTPGDVKKVLHTGNPNKAVSFNNIPLNLAKVTVKTLVTSLSYIMNNSTLKALFSSQAKIAVLSPLDKGVLDKHFVLN